MFKPLLAEKAVIEKLQYPLLATPKIDGIRCCITEDGPVTRKLKPVPNDYVRQLLESDALLHDDGELVTHDENFAIEDFNTIQGNIMRREGKPRTSYMVFDTFTRPDLPYVDRVKILHERRFKIGGDLAITPVLPVQLNTPEELDAYERSMVEDNGWEGIMVRDPNGRYKFGRSGVKEGILLKIKRFEDDEATITGMVEEMKNENEAEKDALGRTKRSSAAAGKTGKGRMGALICLWNKNGIEFELGTGFTAEQRQEIWDNFPDYVGQKLTFSFQGVGTNGRPRFPSFKGMRKDL